MKILNFIKKTNLNDSILIGYYGGGNYGDELLMEIILNLFILNNIININVFYLSYINYESFHKKFENVNIINKDEKIKFIIKLLKNKNIIVGGGGIWGLDFNINVLILSILLFISRFIFFKKIYLLGVGYYNSTTKLGKFGAYLAGKASNVIIARDEESYINFKKYNNKVYLDKDLAFYIYKLNQSIYIEEINLIEKKVKISDKNIIITIRKFSKKFYNNYDKIVSQIINSNNNKNIILALLETKLIHKEGYKFLKIISNKYRNVKIIDFDYNPVAFFYFLKKYKDKILVISPQYHGQIISFLAGINFLPIKYDNKNYEFFKKIKIHNFYDIKKLDINIVQQFINKFYE